MPIQIDTRTLVIAAALISGAMGPLMYMNLRARKAVPGWGLWTISAVMLAGSLLMLALRDVVPDLASVVVGNLLAALGLLFASAGVRLCCGRAARAKWLEASSVGLYCLQMYFFFVHNNQEARVLINSLLLVFIGTYTAAPLLREAPEGREFGYRYTAGVFLFVGALEIVFQFVSPVHSLGTSGLFTNSTGNILHCLCTLLFLVGLAFGYFLLTNERLLADLRTTHELLREGADERLRMQVQMARAERMEAVGRLAGGISHIFNNQMCIVQLNCEQLLDSKEIPESLRFSLRRIREAGKRSSEITARLMEYSRTKSLKNTKFDMASWLQTISGDLRRALGTSVGLEIENTAENTLVCADADQFAGVLMHLAANASHAMPNGGKWTLQVERLALTESRRSGLGLRPGDYVRVSATDTGCGMDEGTLKRIFEPFYSTRSLAVAEGLGMASAFGLVQQSGGTMTASSKLGEGSTVCVYLPLATGVATESGERNQVGIYYVSRSCGPE
jgi:signal transduction histidine kinase